MSSNTQSTATIDGPIATITISTDDGLNVMSTDAMARLGDAVAKVAQSEGVRFTIIRAEGKVFVAGADIKEMTPFDHAAGQKFGELGSAVCDAIENLPSVTIAALQGAALGGGCEIAVACDFRIAVANAKIGMPETTLGLIPGWGGIPRSVRLAGMSAAKRLMFSGAFISAEEGHKLGLIDAVVSDADALDTEIKNWIAGFDRGGPAAIGLIKRAIRDGKDVAAFADCFNTDQAREGMTAFAEKRPASWVTG